MRTAPACPLALRLSDKGRRSRIHADRGPQGDVHHLADPSGRVQHGGRLQQAVVDADEQGPLVANPCPTAIFPVQRIQRNTVPSSSLCGCDAI